MMRNMAGMMKKVQEMQGRLETMQRDLAIMEFTATVGGGAVSATVTGDGKLAKLKLNPDALIPMIAEMLEDMICLATNNANEQAAEKKANYERYYRWLAAATRHKCHYALNMHNPLENLIRKLGRLPGLGPRSADAQFYFC